MSRFGETKVTKEKFHAAKKPIKTWDVNVDNIVNSKVNKTKTNSKYMIGYSDKAAKTFKVKDGDKDKKNKLMSSHIDDKKPVKNIKLF